jgi:hypothetical protein
MVSGSLIREIGAVRRHRLRQSNAVSLFLNGTRR